MLSATMSAQTATNMAALSAEAKAMAVNLKLNGPLSIEPAGDYRQLRDLCFQLRNIDLSEAQSDTVPDNAFHSRHQLQYIKLPAKVRYIGSQAFFA